MSHPSPHDDDDDDSDLIIMKPKPRRPFEWSSPPPSVPSTPPAATSPTFSSHLQTPRSSMEGNTSPAKTRSFLDLTSSALFGIYQPTGYSAEREELSTPWGTGAQTPSMSRQNSLDFTRASFLDTTLSEGPSAMRRRRRSTMRASQIPHRPRRGFKNVYLPLAGRAIAMFGVGVLYAVLITHLHDRRELAPVKVDMNRSSWKYLICWGMAGVFLGEALPWVDRFWAQESDEDSEDMEENETGHSERRNGGWIDVVRSIGAFVGVAFAIRKLPWQSTLQLSLTLALANPAIWYIVDRSPPGFVLSSAVALGGTLLLIGINPALIPSPSPAEVLRGHVLRNGGLVNGTLNAFGSEEFVLGIFTQESVGIATWIASVLFVSAVCFGNIGRRLTPANMTN